MPTVLLLNGPNLNLLGTREPEIYGSMNLSGIEKQVSAVLHEHKIECETFQSNSEGELIDWLHQHKNADFLLLNPGALTHTSIGLRDAVQGIEIPFLEIHLSNVHQREEFRHHSFFSDIAVGSLVGLGVKGYLLAAQFAVDFIEQKGTSAGNRCSYYSPSGPPDFTACYENFLNHHIFIIQRFSCRSCLVHGRLTSEYVATEGGLVDIRFTSGILPDSNGEATHRFG